jgi:hypothetical protein
MIVGLMVMGAVVAVGAIHSGQQDIKQAREWSQEDRAGDALGALRGAPATNTSVYFSHRLEQLIVEHLSGDSDRLPGVLRAHHPADHRLVLQTAARDELVLGPTHLPVEEAPHGASALWRSGLGHTFIRPVISHHDIEMDAVFELLPVWMEQVKTPAGHGMEVRLVDGHGVERSVVHHHRLPIPGQEPLLLEPRSPAGALRWVVQESDVTNGTKYDWYVHVNIQPAGDKDRVWLPQGRSFEVVPPSGWELGVLDADWDMVSVGDGPVWRLDYRGSPMWGDQEGWLNLSLTRSSAEELLRHDWLTVRSASHVGAEATQVLVPSSGVRQGPVMVAASMPSPFSSQEVLPVTLTVMNPGPEPVDLSGLQVAFARGHQFLHEPSDWERSEQGGSVVYTYAGPSVVVAAGGADVLVLPVQVEDEEGGDNVQRDLAPVMEYLGEGKLVPPVRDGLLAPHQMGAGYERVMGAVHGDRSFVAALGAMGLENGTHTVRVGHSAEDRVPPGVGGFERFNDDSDGFLPDLQEVRLGMGLQAGEDATLRPGQPLEVVLNAGSLGSFLLDNSAMLDGDPWLVVEAGDLMGMLSGRPDVVVEDHENFTVGTLMDGYSWQRELVFPRTAQPGPVIVEATLVVPTVDHGEVRLHLMSHVLRAGTSSPMVPVFFTAHLQFWFASGGDDWAAGS